MSHKSKHFLLQACKILVILSCLGYLGWQLQTDSFDRKSVIGFLSGLPVYIYLVLPVLSIASWLVESHKWELLIRDYVELRFRESVIQNLTANTASFITPLKAGEFATKAFYFPSNIRRKVLKAVLVGNLSQMTVTVILGLAGIALLFDQAIIAVGIVVFCVTILYLTSWKFKNWLGYQPSRIVVITSYSTLRYMIFSSSWFLILGFVSNASVGLILGSVTSMYLVSSIVPMMQIFDVFLKWSIASFFVGYLDISLESMTAIVAFVWLNNQVLPVLLGCALLTFQKFPKLVSA